MSIYDDVLFRKVTIADGASLSDELDVQGYDVVALQQAANTEGTAYSFQGSLDGETFADIYDHEGTELSVAKSATLAQVTILTGGMAEPPGDISLKGFQSIKIRTGLTGAATNQTGAATILVGLRAAADPGR